MAQGRMPTGHGHGQGDGDQAASQHMPKRPWRCGHPPEKGGIKLHGQGGDWNCGSGIMPQHAQACPALARKCHAPHALGGERTRRQTNWEAEMNAAAEDRARKLKELEAELAMSGRKLDQTDRGLDLEEGRLREARARRTGEGRPIPSAPAPALRPDVGLVSAHAPSGPTPEQAAAMTHGAEPRATISGRVGGQAQFAGGAQITFKRDPQTGQLVRVR